jgi:hypothetical protein
LKPKKDKAIAAASKAAEQAKVDAKAKANAISC